MRTFKVTLAFIGLTGTYLSEITVKARNEKSAKNKALLAVGDRTLDEVVEIKEEK